MHIRPFVFLFVLAVLGAGAFVLVQSTQTVYLAEEAMVREEIPQFSWAKEHIEQQKDLSVEAIVKQKGSAPVIKGIYLTAYSAASEQKRSAMIDLITQTELNGVVIDIKDYTGQVLYDSEVPETDMYQTKDIRMPNLKEIIQDFHDHDIFVIARQQVFQDPILAEAHPEWAITHANGGLWRDYKGLAWVDPTRKEVWDYNVAIAKEAFALGFDEVNLDYVRFPSDGPVAQARYAHDFEHKHDNMNAFYAYMSDELSGEPGFLSVDLFGFVMERHDGMSIGQRLEDTVDVMDVIAPMMYPSHYPAGHLGLANPAEHPGLVIANGMEKGMPYFEETRAKVRPWIQAFNIGAMYGATNIRAQIDAIEAYDDHAGWLLWNASNRYSSAGLTLREQ
jgi:hypothetical protein